MSEHERYKQKGKRGENYKRDRKGKKGENYKRDRLTQKNTQRVLWCVCPLSEISIRFNIKRHATLEFVLSECGLEPYRDF